MSGAVDTSDIPEQRGRLRPLKRDAQGRLPPRSMIRDAIANELKRAGLTPYALWKRARETCPSLSQSAVHEFLKGARQLQIPYAEALMKALQLSVVRSNNTASPSRAGNTRVQKSG